MFQRNIYVKKNKIYNIKCEKGININIIKIYIIKKKLSKMSKNK